MILFSVSYGLNYDGLYDMAGVVENRITGEVQAEYGTFDQDRFGSAEGALLLASDSANNTLQHTVTLETENATTCYFYIQFPSFSASEPFLSVDEAGLSFSTGSSDNLEVRQSENLILQGTRTLVEGQWYLMAAVIDGAGNTLSVNIVSTDGVTEGTGTLAGAVPDSITFRLGYESSVTPAKRLVVDDVTALRGNLTSAQILKIHDNMSAEQFTLWVGHSTGDATGGLAAHLFKAGSYTGTSLSTNQNGEAVVSLSDLTPANNYRFRVDWLGEQFWTPTIPLPGIYYHEYAIPSDWISAEVSINGAALEDVPVYLFSENGHYSGHGQDTDLNGSVTFLVPRDTAFKLRADHLGTQYWLALDPTSAPSDYNFDLNGGTVTVILETADQVVLEGFPGYLFEDDGSYLGRLDFSDASGTLEYTVSAGDYRVRTDMFGYQFWSNPISVASDSQLRFTVPYSDLEVTVNKVDTETAEPIAGVRNYVFNENDAYIGISGLTDELGQSLYYLPERPFQIRADYLNTQYWSGLTVAGGVEIEIPHGLLQLEISFAGMPLAGTDVYIFDENNQYLSIRVVSDENGLVSLSLPANEYNIRVDHLGNQYWTAPLTLENENNPIEAFSLGGGVFSAVIADGLGNSVEETQVYLFDDRRAYVGEKRTTSEAGLVEFPVAEGMFELRADYLGYQFWSGQRFVDDHLQIDFEIPHRSVTLSASGTLAESSFAMADLKTYLFTEAGSYLGRSYLTDGSGQVTENLPFKPYRFRVDYLNEQYWSETVSDENVSIEIPHATVEFELSGGDFLLPNTRAYAFDTEQHYLGVYATSDANGQVSFTLPENDYVFRVDTHGSKYWTDVVTLAGNGTYTHEYSTGGGVLSFHVLEIGTLLSGVRVFVFDGDDQYLGINGTTDEEGEVLFQLTSGTYKLRVHYEGEQYWTDDLEIESDEATSFDIMMSEDGDADGLPDAWELEHFCTFEQNAEQDADGDGMSNLAEYVAGTDPSDYYNGVAPVINVVFGSQPVNVDSVTERAFEIFLSDANGNSLPNAPVHFSVMGGYAGLVQSPSGETGASSVSLNTDSFGKIQPIYNPLYFMGSSNIGEQFSIRISAGILQEFIEIEVVAGDRLQTPPRQFQSVENSDGSITYSWKGEPSNADRFFIERQNEADEWITALDIPISELPAPDPETGIYRITVPNE